MIEELEPQLFKEPLKEEFSYSLDFEKEDFTLFKDYVSHQLSLAAPKVSEELGKIYGGKFKPEVCVRTAEQLRYVGKRLTGEIDVRYNLADGSSFILGKDPFPGHPEINKNAEKKMLKVWDKIDTYGNREMLNRFEQTLHMTDDIRTDLERVTPDLVSEIEKDPSHIRELERHLSYRLMQGLHGGIMYAHEKRKSLRRLASGAVMIGALLGAASIPLVKGAVGDPLKVPYTKNPPTIDGICHLDEYKNAIKITDKDGLLPYSLVNDKTFLKNAKAFLMLEQAPGPAGTKGNYLYGCLDWTSQKDVSRDMFFNIEFDTRHDGLTKGQLGPDDLHFAAAVTNVVGSKIYLEPFSLFGTPIDKFIIKASLSPSPNDPTSTKNLQYEFAVSMEQITKYPNTSDPSLIGFYMFANCMRAANGVVWPHLNGYTTDKIHYKLGDMIFLPQEITTTTTSISTTTSSISPTITPTTSQTTKITTSENNSKNNSNWILPAIIVGVAGATAGGMIALKKLRKKNLKN